MIETTIPEINVSDLMERVRTKAAEIKEIKRRGLSTNLPRLELPSVRVVSPPPPLALPQPAPPRRERLLEMLGEARTKTEVSNWIPKPLRRFFRRQGGYNRILLESVTLLAKANAELANRLQQLTACVEVQHGWLRELEQHADGTGRWMAASAQFLQTIGEEVERSCSQTQGQLESNGRLVAEFRKEHDQARAHFLNLQGETGLNATKAQALEKRLDDEAKRNAGRMQALEKNLDDTVAAMRLLREEADRAREHLRDLQNENNRNAAVAEGMRRSVDRLVHARGDLERAIAEIDERQTSEGSFIKSELSQQSALLQQRGTSDPPHSRKATPPQKDTTSDFPGRLDAFYLSFENHFRGSSEEIKERLSFYLPVIWESDAGSADRPILDLGCGRGEWLELLREIGATARGVDLNSPMLTLCRQHDLDVVQADALEYLQSLPDNSQGAVTGFHIIEHLPFETLMNVLAEAQRVLKSGGFVIFESPNCKNLVVGACNFYSDPTHRNPVFPDTAAFMLNSQGFERIKIEYLMPVEGSPFDTTRPEGLVLNDWFYGPSDFAVIAHKGKRE